MTDNDRSRSGVVIIGSGLGGYTLAREVRKQAPDVSITIVTADGGESYGKPMLSNAFGQGKTPEQLVQKTAQTMETDLRATILTRSRVNSIDRAAQTISVAGADGRQTAIPYGSLVLAVGADARPFSAPGSDGVDVASVNDLDDYRRWREKLAAPSRILLIGAGLIGCEFANDLRLAGHQVVVVEPGPWPIARLVPQEIGMALADHLRGIGVQMIFGLGISALAPGSATLSDGQVILFDHALSAIGLLPRTKLAEQAGLVIDRGIKVDRFLRSSDPNIYALGDCAATDAGPLPFVLPLMAEARALAQTLTGKETALSLPAMPVSVKTPCLPTVVCPPPVGAQGGWVITGQGSDYKGLFNAPDGTPLGFALTGTFVGERQKLATTMPAVL